MSQLIRDPGLSFAERMRAAVGRRAAGICLALLAEALLVLALLTLAPRTARRTEERSTVFSFSPAPSEEAAPEEVPAPSPPERGEPDPTPPDRPTPEPPVPAPVPPPVVEPLPAPPTVVERMADFDLARIPARPAAAAPRRAVAGPADPGGSSGGDTPRVEGAGPNGEPLYAASWYREPYPEELRGYLSTARGPGWGLIACRTVRDYRVEDCVKVGEYPEGSNIARSVLAAAWQFRVRPPRLGGEPKIGEWVRIRIEYGLQRR